MEAINLRKKIIGIVQDADESYLKKLDEFISMSQNASFVLSDDQKAELDKRRERHLSGESKSYSWQEVKQNLIENHGLQS